MIKKYLSQSDAIYYFSVFFILLAGILAIAHFSGNVRLQALIVVLVSFIYVAWGILHHLLHHDICFKIVVEYILIGAFGMAIILFLLKSI